MPSPLRARAQLAAANWAGGKKVAFKLELVEQIYADHIRDDPTATKLAALEQSGYLER